MFRGPMRSGLWTRRPHDPRLLLRGLGYQHFGKLRWLRSGRRCDILKEQMNLNIGAIYHVPCYNPNMVCGQ